MPLLEPCVLDEGIKVGRDRDARVRERERPERPGLGDSNPLLRHQLLVHCTPALEKAGHPRRPATPSTLAPTRPLWQDLLFGPLLRKMREILLQDLGARRYAFPDPEAVQPHLVCVCVCVCV